VRFAAQEVSYHLRQTALQCELATRKRLMEEMKIPDWRLEEAIDFYTLEGSHQSVQPLDRLIVFMSLASLFAQKGREILTNYKRK
jgi:hypothetical protein